jgi:hypothetical protein
MLVSINPQNTWEGQAIFTLSNLWAQSSDRDPALPVADFIYQTSFKLDRYHKIKDSLDNTRMYAKRFEDLIYGYIALTNSPSPHPEQSKNVLIFYGTYNQELLAFEGIYLSAYYETFAGPFVTNSNLDKTTNTNEICWNLLRTSTQEYFTYCYTDPANGLGLLKEESRKISTYVYPTRIYFQYDRAPAPEFFIDELRPVVIPERGYIGELNAKRVSNLVLGWFKTYNSIQSNHNDFAIFIGILKFPPYEKLPHMLGVYCSNKIEFSG